MEVDLLDHHSLHEAMEGVESVYNLASPPPGSESDYRANTEGLLNLLEAAVEAKVKSFVHLSTVDVHGFGGGTVGPDTPFKPENDYQRSKAEAERLLAEFVKRNSTPRVATIRAARAFGSRDPTLASPLLRGLASGKVVLPFAGTMSFTHPLDISQAMLKAATGTLPSGSVFLVKSFDAAPDALARELGKQVESHAEVKKPGIFARSSLPAYTSQQLSSPMRFEVQPSWGALGYVPQFDLQKACEEVAKWYKKEPWVTEAA